MKDCSLKICLGCHDCKSITLTKKGFWVPHCEDTELICFDEIGNYKSRFSCGKGSCYGPTEHCPFNFEHKVLDDRKNFKLKKFEDLKVLYEYIQENKLSIIKRYGNTFSIIKDNKFYPMNNFWRFEEFILSMDDYASGKIGKIFFKEEEMTFEKDSYMIEISKLTWLNRFEKKRQGTLEDVKSDKKHRIVFPVAGVTFESRQNTIKNLTDVFNSGKRFKVELEPEPNNEYDSNAIKVIVLNEGKKEFIGYVPKTLNKDQDNEYKIDNFNSMIYSILQNIEKAETSWIGEKNGNYGVRVVCYEKIN